MRPGPIRPGDPHRPLLLNTELWARFNEARADSPGRYRDRGTLVRGGGKSFNEARADSPGRLESAGEAIKKETELQ